MCGIAGIYSERYDILDKISLMTQAQEHRGPDSEGHVFLGKYNTFFKNEKLKASDNDVLALGHRRLAIIDRSEAGIQPMSSFSKEDWICYNGEVYNYVELRTELIRLGHNFRTETDTEVILSSYLEWGLDCFTKFNGMWSIAIWDNKRQELILSRDRLGVKPLHYAFVDGVLLFASEIKGILASNLLEAELNVNTAIDFLKWSATDHDNNTFFKDIFSFPAGHYAVIPRNDIKAPQAISYWKLEAKNLDSTDFVSDYKALFTDSVRLRMRSDVEVGACLSGGLDSSSIVCVADKLNKEKTATPHALNTFNSAFEDHRFDERYWANIVNDKIQANAHYVFTKPEAFKEEIEKIVFDQEAPFASASVYAQWKLMELSNNKHIKVLLDGQGADEILCGYRKYFYFYLTSLFRQKKIGKFTKELFFLIKNGDKGIWNWRDGWRYLPRFMRNKIPDLSLFLTDKGNQYWQKSKVQLSGNTSVAERQIDDVLKFSIPVLLRYEDRNSMAWSVETRVPFLDYRLVEWSINAPIDIKLNQGRTKAILRSAMRGVVPDEILDRRDKMGFVTAQEVWMRNELKDSIRKSILDVQEKLSTIIDVDDFLKEYSKWSEGRSSLRYQDIFRVYAFALWLKVYNVSV